MAREITGHAGAKRQIVSSPAARSAITEEDQTTEHSIQAAGRLSSSARRLSAASHLEEEHSATHLGSSRSVSSHSVLQHSAPAFAASRQTRSLTGFGDPRKLAHSDGIMQTLAEQAQCKTGIFTPSTHREELSEAEQLVVERRKTSFKRAALVVAGAVLLFFIAWVLAFSPALQVSMKDVTVKGTNQWVSEQQVRTAIKGRLDRSLILIPSKELKEPIEQIRTVDEVKIERTLPHHITIHVVTRTPQAVLKDASGKFTVVDKNSVIMGQVKQPMSNAPVISVNEVNQALRTDAIQQTLKVLSAMSPELRANMSEVSAATRDSISTKTKDNFTIVWGDASQMPLKIDEVKHLLGNEGAMGTNTIIDVSVPDRPILKS